MNGVDQVTISARRPPGLCRRSAGRKGQSDRSIARKEMEGSMSLPPGEAEGLSV